MNRPSGNALRLAQFIDSHTRVKGYAPNFREMRAEFGFAHNGSIVNLLKQLEHAGLAERLPPTPSSPGVKPKRRDRSVRILLLHPHTPVSATLELSP